MVLADGMGGYNAGEVASGMCTAFIKTELGRWLAEASESATDSDVRRAMDICVDNANRAIFNAANSNPQYAGMGTTLVVGVFRDNRLLLGHVGDSRCYRQRGGRLVQITHDHSLLQEQIDAGLITAEQAAFSANKNLVTRAVGVEDTVLLETHLHDVMPGDVYALCSDGLSDMVDDETISQLLQSRELLPEAASALIDAANEAGGKDNISVVLVRVRGPGGCRAIVVAVSPLSLPGCRPLASVGRRAQEDKRQIRDSRSEAMGKLVVSLDGVVIKEVQITKDKTTLGRRPYNDIVIDNLAVSGEHAVLQMVGADVFIEDLNSTNGTYINGKAVKKQLLAAQRHRRGRQVQDQVHGRRRHRL